MVNYETTIGQTTVAPTASVTYATIPARTVTISPSPWLRFGDCGIAINMATGEVTIPDGDVKATELALAKQLIEQTATDDFAPEKYKDTVRERVMETIQRKIDGQDITADVTPDGGGKIIDLMEALKASLAATKPAEAAVKAS